MKFRSPSQLSREVVPDILDRVEFWCLGRQREQGDVVGHDEVVGDVPSGAVED